MHSGAMQGLITRMRVIPVSAVLGLSTVGFVKGTSGALADDVVVSATGCTRLCILLTISSIQRNAIDRP